MIGIVPDFGVTFSIAARRLQRWVCGGNDKTYKRGHIFEHYHWKIVLYLIIVLIDCYKIVIISI